MTNFGTANLGNKSDDRVYAGVRDLFEHHHLAALGIQEGGDRKPVLNELCADLGLHAWFGDGPGAASTPIMWDPKAVEARRTFTRPATPATDTGRLGVGPNVVKAKVWNLVRFATDDGPLVFINGHLPASLWAPRRRELAERQVAVLADMVQRRAGKVPIIAVMDGNAKPGDRIWLPLRRLGMEQHTHAPTHGRRCIDLTWTLGIDGRAHVVPATFSDHRPVVLTLKETR